MLQYREQHFYHCIVVKTVICMPRKGLVYGNLILIFSRYVSCKDYLFYTKTRFLIGDAMEIPYSFLYYSVFVSESLKFCNNNLIKTIHIGHISFQEALSAFRKLLTGISIARLT